MPKLREGVFPIFVWAGVSVVGLFIARAGWEAIYDNWEKNGQNFSAPPQQTSPRISTSVVLSQPAAPSTNQVTFTESYSRRRKRELVTSNAPHYDWKLEPGQATEWTSLSEHENRRKGWFVMVDGKATQYLRYWDDTYEREKLTPSNTAIDEWNTPAKDARWGRWENTGTRPVSVKMWLYE
jgi:hypothetical protein